MKLPPKFKKEIINALLAARNNYDGSDSAFATSFGLNGSVYSQIKQGKSPDGLIKDNKLLTIARILGVNQNERNWKAAKTEVFEYIEEDIDFCQKYSKAKIFVDQCGIGKTFTAKYLSRTRKNCFYVDASQAKTKQLFIRLIAKTIGVDSTGKYAEVKADLKYYLQQLPQPIIIIDEAGDLHYPAFLEVKELWNATEGTCGWYLMGANGLRAKISKGINNKKVGFEEIFSRFSDRYTSVVPTDINERKKWYRQIITQVLRANMENKKNLNQIVSQCLKADHEGNISGLRRAESLLILNN